MLRILIADDHEVARRGIRAVLESHTGWEVCGEAKDGRESVELAAATKPDLVLLDIGMPNLNGLEAARQILATAPNVAILILTMHDSDNVVRDVLRAGARWQRAGVVSNPALIILCVYSLRWIDWRPSSTYAEPGMRRRQPARPSHPKRRRKQLCSGRSQSCC